ncbi:TonB-dependent receptor [Gammaproteobacteria bacterium]
MATDQYLYLFIRTDLSPEVQMVQCAHATFELGLDLNRSKHPEPVNFVLIGINSERELIQIKRDLERDGIQFHLFHEPDYGTGYTALATEPLRGDERNRFADYPIYKRKRDFVAA